MSSNPNERDASRPAETQSFQESALGAKIRRLQESAKSGDAAAIRELAYRYRFGDGVERDRATSLRLYRRAAELGNVDAIATLAYFYEKGDGVEKDANEAGKPLD